MIIQSAGFHAELGLLRQGVTCQVGILQEGEEKKICT
jgi:hypothetical protein